jgi:hypothetical protein
MTRLWIIGLIIFMAGCNNSPERNETRESSGGTAQKEPSDKPSPRDEVERLKKEIQEQAETGSTKHTMGIKCYLEKRIPGCEPSSIGGRYLAQAYIASSLVAGIKGYDSPIVAIGQFQCTGPEGAERQKMHGRLGPFPERWHEASIGLATMHPILEKFRDRSGKIFLPDSPPDLRDGVIHDLESIERVLKAADQQRVRFYLALEP